MKFSFKYFRLKFDGML